MQKRLMFDCGHVHLAQDQDPKGSGAVLLWVFGLYHHKHGDARRVSQAPLSQSPQTCAITAATKSLASLCSHEMHRHCYCLSSSLGTGWSWRTCCILLPSPQCSWINFSAPLAPSHCRPGAQAAIAMTTCRTVHRKHLTVLNVDCGPTLLPMKLFLPVCCEDRSRDVWLLQIASGLCRKTMRS